MKSGESGCGLLLLTHGKQGACLLESVAHMLGEEPADVIAIGLVGTERRSEIENRAAAAAAKLHSKCGSVLIFTDLLGSTQANIAEKITTANKDTLCVHGVNLVMLLEAIAMRCLPLKKLQQQVIQAGRKSVCYGGR